VTQLSSSSPRKVGFLGAGYILHAHAKAVAAVPGLSLHAVCDLSLSRARDAASRFGIANACSSIDELIALGCESVHVLLPPNAHAGAALRLIEAGVDVLIEKPMALSSQECEAIMSAAQARKVRVGVVHNFLFMASHERLRDAVRKGVIGPVQNVTVDWHGDLPQARHGPFDQWMLRSPGNLMLELGPHSAAFALDLVGPVDDVQAIAGRPLELPNKCTIYRRWSVNGSAGRACFSLNIFATPGEPLRRVTVRGLAGVATLDFLRDTLTFEKVRASNPAFEGVGHGVRAAAQVLSQGLVGTGRALAGVLRKTPTADPYRESIWLCVRAFYADGKFDNRISPAFGAQVIGLCEKVIQKGLGSRAEAAAQPAVGATRAPAMDASGGGPRALVVGGTGFIGKRLVRELIEAGYGVRVLSRNANSASAELPDPRVEVMQGWHGDPVVARKCLAGVDVVFHLAKAAGERWEDYVANDVEPTKVLAEAALECGVKRFIYTGTIDSYDSADAQTTIGGDTLLDPRIATRNLYARSKAACEALLLDMRARSGLPLVIVRPGIVIGSGMPPAHWGVGMFHADSRVELWGDGEHPLPFVLVDDVARALRLAAEAKDVEGRAFVVTDDPLLSARDYVRAVGQRLSAAMEVRATPLWLHFLRDASKQAVKHLIRHPNRRAVSLHDWRCRAHRSTYNNAMTKQALAWQPAGTRERLLAEGVEGAVDWYLR
jgi:predicted dehydrogenase/nucleoside-diphosphate-sugar epimerase